MIKDPIGQEVYIGDYVIVEFQYWIVTKCLKTHKKFITVEMPASIPTWSNGHGEFDINGPLRIPVKKQIFFKAHLQQWIEAGKNGCLVKPVNIK